MFFNLPVKISEINQSDEERRLTATSSASSILLLIWAGIGFQAFIYPLRIFAEHSRYFYDNTPLRIRTWEPHSSGFMDF